MDHYEQSLQRRKAIEDGLLELMQHEPFPQISVTSLTQHLGMSRKCFYHYFSGKESCLESLIDRMIRDAALYVAVTASDAPHHLPQYVRNLEYWKSQRLFLEAILAHKLDTVFLRRCMMHYLQEEKALHEQMETAEIEFDEDILLFYVSGQLHLLLRWCQRGFEPSEEEMARKFRRLFQMPLIQIGEE